MANQYHTSIIQIGRWQIMPKEDWGAILLIVFGVIGVLGWSCQLGFGGGFEGIIPWIAGLIPIALLFTGVVLFHNLAKARICTNCKIDCIRKPLKRSGHEHVYVCPQCGKLIGTGVRDARQAGPGDLSDEMLKSCPRSQDK